MKKIHVVFLLVLAILDANACDRKSLKPSEAFQEADRVFRGKVENLRYLDDPDKVKLEAKIIVTFSVTENWKGKVEKITIIHTTHNKTTCNGYIFEAGKEYLIYARLNKRVDNFIAKLFAPEKTTLGIKVYGGSKLFSEAGKDLKFLGKGKRIE